MSLPAALVRIEGLALECDVLRAQTHHGRDDPSSQPNADSVTLEIVGPLPAAATIGAELEVSAVLGATEYPRFAGRVSDIAIAWDSVDVSVATLIAVGELAELGRRIIGDAPYPSETDGARVNRALAAAGVSTDPIRSDPGTLLVLGRDVDAQPALAIASDAASDGGGFVWQATDGAVLYADAAHRRRAIAALALDACDVPLSIVWAVGLEGLCNDARVRYGVAPEGGEQPEVHASDPESIAALGTYGANLATRLASEADASARAQLIVIRQAAPAWVVAGLGFPLEMLDPALTVDLLGLEVHDLVSLTGLPAGSPQTSASLFVEGWSETIVPGSWTLDISVSDYCRTAPAPQWDEVDLALTWDTLPPITWDESTCIPPILLHGRWADVPVSLRWDQAGPTWDTWE